MFALLYIDWLTYFRTQRKVLDDTFFKFLFQILTMVAKIIIIIINNDNLLFFIENKVI